VLVLLVRVQRKMAAMANTTTSAMLMIVDMDFCGVGVESFITASGYTTKCVSGIGGNL
jgi:hypothetical protein